MDITNEVQIIRYSKGKQSCLMDVVTQEYFLDIFVNGEKYSSLNCTPRELTELVIGHLICEGVITDKRDLTSLDINEQKGTADSAVKEKSPKPDESDPKKVYHTSFLFENLENFYSTSELFYSTGAVHKSALYNDEGFIMDAVDISRHNTVDKLMGKANLQGINLSQCYMIISGRVHLEIVKKVACAGIKMLVSRSAPSAQAIEEAKKRDITLLGFARGDRFNVYCGEKRIDMGI